MSVTDERDICKLDKSWQRPDEFDTSGLSCETVESKHAFSAIYSNSFISQLLVLPQNHLKFTSNVQHSDPQLRGSCDHKEVPTSERPWVRSAVVRQLEPGGAPFQHSLIWIHVGLHIRQLCQTQDLGWTTAHGKSFRPWNISAANFLIKCLSGLHAEDLNYSALQNWQETLRDKTTYDLSCISFPKQSMNIQYYNL